MISPDWSNIQTVGGYLSSGSRKNNFAASNGHYFSGTAVSYIPSGRQQQNTSRPRPDNAQLVDQYGPNPRSRRRSQQKRQKTRARRKDRAFSGSRRHTDKGSWSVWRNSIYAMVESRKNMFCHNCTRKHPPELCRGPLDHRGLVNCCGFCGHKHLIDDCRQLKKLSPLSQGLWMKYIIFESRRGLAPFATRKRYDMSNFHGPPHLNVLNPKMAKWWENQVMAFDGAAGRTIYWRRFRWDRRTLKPTVDLFSSLPCDPTIPPQLRNTGPPSHVAPSSNSSAGYPDISIFRDDELAYKPHWLLFESGPRTPPDTSMSIKEARVRLGWMNSLQTRLEWPEPMDIDP